MIVKLHHRQGKYTVILVAIGEDTSISFAAKGIMLYLMGKPKHWVGNVKDLRRAGGGIGQLQCRNIIKELEKAGYMAFRRQRGNRGRFQSWYDAFESPLPVAQRTKSWENNMPDAVRTAPWESDSGQCSTETVVDNTNKELNSVSKEKEVQQPPPPKWKYYESQFGKDLLTGFADHVKDAAFEACEEQYKAAKVGCIPANVPGFDRDALSWARAFAFHGKTAPAVAGLLKRSVAYLALDATMRNLNLPVWKILDEVGIGEKGMAKPVERSKDPVEIQEEHFRQQVAYCVDDIKADLRRSYQRKKKLSVHDAANARSAYPLAVRRKAEGIIGADEDLSRELKELWQAGPLRFATVPC